MDAAAAYVQARVGRAGAIPRVRRAAASYLGGLALAFVPLAVLSTNAFWLTVLTYTYLFAGLAVAWNILAGFGGQFSLGHGVFFAIGAYVTAKLFVDHGLSPWLSILPSTVG